MEISATTALWFLPFVLPIALWVAWSDLATMKIPNKAVLALLAVFVVVGFFALPSLNEYLWRYAHFGVVIVITFLLSTFGLIGAGDAKFVAAMAPFIALPDAYSFLVMLAVIIIAAFIVHRFAKRTRALRNRVPHWESWERKEFPMGFALAPALVIYLLIGAFAG